MKRYWELDFLRAIAVLMMIAFHFCFDLNLIFNTSISLKYWNIPIYILFFILVGISSCLSFQNYVSYSKEIKVKNQKVFFYFFKKSIKIFLAAILVSFFSYLFDKKNFIFFGTLHFIFFSILISSFLLTWSRKKLFFLAFICLSIGYFLRKNNLSSFLNYDIINNLYFFSIFKKFILLIESRTTFDYYPLLPYFYLVLVGIIIGKTFYQKQKKIHNLFHSFLEKIRKKIEIILSPFLWIGKNALLIYLIHQPILIVILMGIKFVFKQFD